MFTYRSAFLLAFLPLAFPLLVRGENLSLGTAGNFSVLAATTITSTGPTVINLGDIGLSPGSAITGFPPGTLTSPNVFHVDDAVALQAKNDLNTAYNTGAALAPTTVLASAELGGLTLTPGTYKLPVLAMLTGTLTLNDLGDPNAQFVFQIASTLTTATDSSVLSINDDGDPSCSVFWLVGSSATLGTGTDFQGHILAQTSITMNTDASITDGSALALNGAVTLDSNAITNCTPTVELGSTAPEPASFLLLLLAPVVLILRKPARLSTSHKSSPTP